MRMKQIKKSLSLIFCMMLIVAMALFTSGCNDKSTQTTGTQETETSAVVEETAETTETSAVVEETAETTETSAVVEKTAETTENQVQTKESQTEEEVSEAEVTVLGEGETKFLFTVVDKDGAETAFEIHTDKEIVGDALLELELIAGEEGEFGLYVKTVNGIVADYDVDAAYWAFYVNGEYATSGVDSTTIEEGTAYMFKVEK